MKDFLGIMFASISHPKDSYYEYDSETKKKKQQRN